MRSQAWASSPCHVDGTPVGVNVAQVAYFVALPEGTTRIVFAGGSTRVQENALAEGGPEGTLEVAESFDEVMLSFVTP